MFWGLISTAPLPHLNLLYLLILASFFYDFKGIHGSYLKLTTFVIYYPMIHQWLCLRFKQNIL